MASGQKHSDQSRFEVEQALYDAHYESPLKTRDIPVEFDHSPSLRASAKTLWATPLVAARVFGNVP